MPHRGSLLRPYLILFFTLVFAGAPAGAQSLFGTILGTVTDNSQAVVPKALVRIRNLHTNAARTVTTDASGDYQAPALPVGDYEISCQASGFKQAVISSVTLTVDQRQRVDIRLEVGAIEQQVAITAHAPISRIPRSRPAHRTSRATGSRTITP